jgi:inner membrane protein
MALSRAGLKSRTALATSTLVIANNLPDIDVGVFATNTLAMSFRRGWTHGVLAQVTLPIALTGAMLLYDRYRKTRSPDDRVVPSQILMLSYLGVLLHVFMDWTNSYGVRLLMPFSEAWFYGDALYIVDPWLYLTLGLGWWLAKSQPRPARIGRAA